MKKVSLLSLLAVLAVSSAASAANVEDPLYAPAAKKLYSKTSLSKEDKTYTLTEEVGYGFTDKFNAHAALNFVKNDDENGLGAFEAGVKYRALTGSTILDIYGDITLPIDEDVNVGGKNWIGIDAGVIGGIQTQKYTVAGKLGFGGVKETKGEKDFTKGFDIGVEGAYTFDDKWSAQASLESQFGGDFDNFKEIDLTIQGNYAANSGLWSLAISKDIKHSDSDETYTLKYGIQF